MSGTLVASAIRRQARPLRVIVALDGSAGASVAERLVGTAPWPSGTHVLIVSAMADVVMRLASGTSPSQAVRIEAAARLGLEDLQRVAAETLRSRGLSVATHLAGGRPADVLLDLERVERPDLVVMGSRGLGPIESLLLGSTSTAVVVRGRSNVLVARRDAVARVVLATDGSSAARRAEHLLATWPLGRVAEIHVVAVQRSPGREAETLAQRLSLDAAMRLRKAGLAASAEVRAGDPAGGILDVAAETDADLIAVGARGSDGPTRSGVGGVARNVLAAGPSVLVARRAPGGRG